MKLASLFAGGVSIRESARILGCTYKTAYLKYKWMGSLAKAEALNKPLLAEELQIDELLTIEHTKLKPLSVILAVDNNYQIAGFQVAQLKPFGHLASIAYRKYGPRTDNSKEKLQDLLKQLCSQSKTPIKIIKTDEKPSYRAPIKEHFPTPKHLRFLGEAQKEKSREQKYLSKEKRKFDPLFSVNHTCARLRDHIKRLTRRSWCTTKKIEHLEFGLYLYMAKANQFKFLR